MALAGALAAGSLAAEPAVLRGAYALLMLSISAYLVLTCATVDGCISAHDALKKWRFRTVATGSVERHLTVKYIRYM